jgi:DNA-binding transcriptional MerR regulator
VRRVGNKLCISREAFDGQMPGAAGTSPLSTAEQFKRVDRRLQAIGRTVMELRELVDDSAEGVHTARASLHELREAIRGLNEKIDTLQSSVKLSA